MPQNERVSKFVAAITREAEEKRAQIEKDTQEYIKKELEKAEDEVLSEAYKLIQRKAAMIRSDIGREFSKQQLACRKELFVRRDQISAQVFEKASGKIVEFTGSGKYEGFLLESVKKAAAKLGNSKGCTVFLRDEDLKFSDAVRSALGECTVCADSTIVFGGVKVKSGDGTILADDTLDTRLQSQHAWFQENCGLTIM